MGWIPTKGEVVIGDDGEQYKVVCIALEEYPTKRGYNDSIVVYKSLSPYGLTHWMTLSAFRHTFTPFGCVRDDYTRHEWLHSVLKRARDTYGNKDQVAVACEELNELAAVLCKYQRYDSHEAAMEGIRDKVVEEIGDVEMVLNHLYAIFSVDQGSVLDNVMRKADRLERWLDTGKTLEQSTRDRELKEVGAVNGTEGI